MPYDGRFIFEVFALLEIEDQSKLAAASSEKLIAGCHQHLKDERFDWKVHGDYTSWRKKHFGDPPYLFDPIALHKNALVFIQSCYALQRMLFADIFQTSIRRDRRGPAILRSKRLRNLLNLDQSSALSDGLSARNAHVHIDERLDSLCCDWDGSKISTERWAIIPPNRPPRNDHVPFRAIDAQHLVYWVLGEKLALEPLIGAVSEICENLQGAWQKLDGSTDLSLWEIVRRDAS